MDAQDLGEVLVAITIFDRNPELVQRNRQLCLVGRVERKGDCVAKLRSLSRVAATQIRRPYSIALTNRAQTLATSGETIVVLARTE
jgi:hypothetical protein